MLPVLLTQTILFQDTSTGLCHWRYDMLKGFVTASHRYGRPERNILAALVYFVVCFSIYVDGQTAQTVAIIR
jgi:hypothetical protein